MDPTAHRLTTPRSPGPDLLRALAIVLVMLWHLPRPARLDSLEGLRQFGWTGVDLFFVLSGYLIGTQLLTPVARGELPRLPEFYLKRSLRILPAFLTVLALYAWVPALHENLPPVWRYLTFTMNFGLDYRVGGPFTQAWSLCVEEHFYLLLPALVLMLRKADWRGWALLLASGVLVGGMALRAALWLHVVAATLPATSNELSPIYLKTIYYPTYCRLDGLLFGVLLAAYRCFYPEHWRRYADPRAALLLGVATITLASFLFHYPSAPFIGGPTLSLLGATFGYPLLSFGCACLLSASLDWERYFAGWRVPGAAAIATISYSLYLTHKMASHLDPLLFDAEALAGVSGLAIYFASSLAVAVLLWATVERPFLLLRDRLIRSRRSDLAPGARPSEA
ncbi:MAG: acyltransferase [Steroidobacteraceae bacterium]